MEINACRTRKDDFVPARGLEKVLQKRQHLIWPLEDEVHLIKTEKRNSCFDTEVTGRAVCLEGKLQRYSHSNSSFS